jgi:membrane protease YdiL (CAAX protease family)
LVYKPNISTLTLKFLFLKMYRRLDTLIIHPRSFIKSQNPYYFYIICIFLIIGLHLFNTCIQIFLEVNIDLDTFSNSSVIKVISALLIAPVVEEIIFRTHLGNKDWNAWFIYLMLIVVAAVFWNISRIMSGSIFVLISFLLIITVKNKGPKLIFNKYFAWIFFLTAILFSLVHIQIVHEALGSSSYRLSIAVTLVSFLPVGIIFGLIRMKFGLPQSILFHGLNNLIALSLNEIFVLLGH